jgi:hypothetical protein
VRIQLLNISDKPLILNTERVKGIEPSSSAWKSVARRIAVRASEISRGRGITPGEQDHGRRRQCGLPIGHSEISRNINVLHRRKAERGVASCGAARNRSPREAGTPPSRHYDLGARSSLHGSARQLPAVVGRRGAQGDGSAAPGAQNRHGGAPRGERPASWDARRLARRLVRRVMAYRTGVPPSTRTFLGAPPTPHSG